MDKFNQIKSLIATLEEDMDKFYNKGNKAAGTRIRVSLQNVKTLAQELRLEVQAKKSEK
jgi:hypothetical protein